MGFHVGAYNYDQECQDMALEFLASKNYYSLLGQTNVFKKDPEEHL